MTRPDPNARRNHPAFPFVEKAAAERYSKICGLLPADAASRLPQCLVEAANPEQAVLQLEVLLEQHPAEALAAFRSSTQALRSCVMLFGASQWLGQTLLHNSDLLQPLARPSGLGRSRSVEDFREQLARVGLRSHDTPLPVLLARFKRREYVRIFTRELLDLASLSEITGEISALSDVMIERALAHCESELRRRYQGWPQLRSSKGRVQPARFSVLSLGKLGGNELNYSSDVDLLYLRDDGEDAGTISISAPEFFTRLAQDLTAILSDVNAEGQIFRVDLRLRPQGLSGEMVVGCAQALRYYRSVAKDWELQALLKLRCSAGDSTLAREFIEQGQELIYCKEISLSAIQTAAHSLERIRRRPGRKGTRDLDVKNGAGGLREIEFLVQCLQRVHGGAEPWLRSSGTLSALQKLHDKSHIGDVEFRELCEGYEFLRSIEHRLQCRQGVQTHRLPEAACDQAALFRSVRRKAAGCTEELQQLMKSVSDLCARVLRLGSEEGNEIMVSPGLGAPGADYLGHELAARSVVLAKAMATGVGNPALQNLRRFLAASATGEERIHATLRNVQWIERALPVFAQSSLATDILARHPEDIRALFLDLDGEVGRSIPEQLRIEYRRCILRSLGRSLLEATSVWEVLRAQSECFDGIVQRALRTVDAPEGFAVFAVGRLGTRELDVVADADLVFVRSVECAKDAADRCARALVTMLSGYTREGSVIAVDTRLRPHGSEGELVVSSRQFAQYCENEAKAWEVVAFSKLRLIAGTERIASDVGNALAALQKRFAADPQFIPDLRAMRLRIANSAGANSFKTGHGGLYDLDFMVGLLEARAGLTGAGKQLYVRLVALMKRELLSEQQGRNLLRAADLFRRVDHAIRTVEGRSRTWLPESDGLRTNLAAMVGCSDLENTLLAEMKLVRGIFQSFFRD